MPLVAGQLAAAEDMNTVLSDIAAALTDSFATDGSAAINGSLNMNGYSLTGANTVAATALVGNVADVTVLNCYSGCNLSAFLSAINGNGQQISNLGYLSSGTLVSWGDCDVGGTVNAGAVSANAIYCNALGLNGDLNMNAHWITNIGALSGQGGLVNVLNTLNMAAGIEMNNMPLVQVSWISSGNNGANYLSIYAGAVYFDGFIDMQGQNILSVGTMTGDAAGMGDRFWVDCHVDYLGHYIINAIIARSNVSDPVATVRALAEQRSDSLNLSETVSALIDAVAELSRVAA